MSKKINKKNNEDKLIEKIDKVNKKMEEIKKEPIKKVSKKKIKDDKKDQLTEKKEHKFGIFEAVIVLVNLSLIFCLLGYLIGVKANYKEKNNYTVSDSVQTFIDQYNYIKSNYYGQVDDDKLITGAINGMLSTLDNYSGVIDNKSNTFDITLNGTYEGIGVSIANNDAGQIIVTSIFEGTPAAKAGIKVGDIITYFNDNSLSSVSSSDFVNMVKDNNEMTLTILRDGTEQKISLKKEQIEIKSVYYNMVDNNIGYIQVTIFANNTYEQFKAALEDLESKGMTKLIIDLRGNSGGHLTAAESMLSLFVDSTHVIYETEDSNGIEKTYSKGTTNKDYPIVILQDSNSASASEIMASSLKENLNAYIIGNKSYGKGTVQQLQVVGDIEYKFTTKKWLTPNGNWVDGVGITPDLEVNLSSEYVNNPLLANDNQYQAAVDHLK